MQSYIRWIIPTARKISPHILNYIWVLDQDCLFSNVYSPYICSLTEFNVTAKMGCIKHF